LPHKRLEAMREFEQVLNITGEDRGTGRSRGTKRDSDLKMKKKANFTTMWGAKEGGATGIEWGE